MSSGMRSPINSVIKQFLSIGTILLINSVIKLFICCNNTNQLNEELSHCSPHVANQLNDELITGFFWLGTS